jgi:hypothetical protein
MTQLCRAICRVEHCIINIGANRYELTPEERRHGKVKLQMRNPAPDTIAEIRQRTDRGFAGSRNGPVRWTSTSLAYMADQLALAAIW